MAARDGEAARAFAEATEGVAICRRHGMAHIGPFALGALALAEPDPDVRRRWLAEGEAQLALGGVSHNHLWLREVAIETLLDLGDWDGVDAVCDRLLAYTAAEPLPFWDAVIARSRALAEHGRDRRDASVRATLQRLRYDAGAADMLVAVRQIDRALAQA
jgi:hypothetical protein